MPDVLPPRAPVETRFTAQQMYLAALRMLLPVREEPPNSNAGQMVEAFLKKCGHKKGAPWCMACLSFAGEACFGARWPFTMTAGTNDCSDQAKRKGLRFHPSVAEPGDIVLLWSEKMGRFYHAFVLERLQPGTARWDTLEGNTNDDGSAEGNRFMRRAGPKGRVLKAGDRLVKWHRGLR